MIVYFDTSALLKRYVVEAGSDAVATLWKWAGLHRIEVDAEINRLVDDLVMHYPLRGADAIHLASAIRLRDLAQSPVTFACADVALVNAARAEGFAIAP